MDWNFFIIENNRLLWRLQRIELYILMLCENMSFEPAFEWFVGDKILMVCSQHLFGHIDLWRLNFIVFHHVMAIFF